MSDKAIPITTFSVDMMKEFVKFDVFGKGENIMYTGVTFAGEKKAYIMGPVPEYNVRNVKLLYNAGWSQRLVGLFFGVSAPRICAMLKDQSVYCPRVS